MAGRMITREKALVVPATFPRLTSWSFSVYRRYEGCPRMVALEKLTRKQASNKGMDRGSDIHTDAEGFLLDKKAKKIPISLKLVEDHVKIVKADPTTQVELQAAFTVNWNVTDWFAKDAWVRIKVDARRELDRKGSILRLSEVTDWKSGKPNAQWDEKQAEVYALGEMAAYGAQAVKTVFAHTDTGDESEALFKIAEQASLRKEWAANTKRMLADVLFLPTPKSWICSWCPYNGKKIKGAPCMAAAGDSQFDTRPPVVKKAPAKKATKR